MYAIRIVKTIPLSIALFCVGFHAAAQETKPKTEKHLKNIRQLTFGGNNAEAYFSPNGKYLTFQSDYLRWGLKCDQIFRLDIAKATKDTTYRPQLISTSYGRTTCSYFMHDGKHILYASTHIGNHACPAPPPTDMKKYVWPIYHDFDILKLND